MKTTTLANFLFAALAVIVLDACSQTSNGSAPAAAVTSCVMAANGTYVDQNGNPCNPATQATTCPANGQYYYNGQYTPCTPGQLVYPNGGYTSPSGYPYQSNPQTGCSAYLQIYGQPYVPMYLDGQLVCANYYDLLQSMQQTSYYDTSYTSTPYYTYGQQYYYAYPPYGYSSGSGSGCNAGLAFSYEDFGAAFCF